MHLTTPAESIGWICMQVINCWSQRWLPHLSGLSKHQNSDDSVNFTDMVVKLGVFVKQKNSNLQLTQVLLVMQ